MIAATIKRLVLRDFRFRPFLRNVEANFVGEDPWTVVTFRRLRSTPHHFNYDSWNRGILAVAAAEHHRSCSASHNERQRSMMDLADTETEECAAIDVKMVWPIVCVERRGSITAYYRLQSVQRVAHKVQRN